jgi:hypothetical protein
MVSKEDVVYVVPKEQTIKSSVNILGVGFESKEDIEMKIKEVYSRNPGDYEYGILKSKGQFNIPEPPEKSFNSTEINTKNNILNSANEDSRVINSSTYDSTQTFVICSINRQRIRYKNGEVDFSFGLDTDQFDSVPLSTLDEEIESKIRGIFNDIVDGHGEYLGYESSYASRGRRNPYVRVYGRIHRDSEKDKEIRRVLNENDILDIYWSDDNINPIPMYYKNIENREYTDVTVVLDYVSQNNSYYSIEDSLIQKIHDRIEKLESEYNLIVNWIGKTFYNRESNQICIGVKYTKNN